MIGDQTKTSETATRLRPDTLAVSVAILLAANLVQRSIGFGRGVVFCRWLTPDELGTWELAYSFLLLAAPVVVLGLPGSFGRYLERFRQRGQLRTFLRRAVLWTGSLTLSAVVLLVAASPLVAQVLFGQSDYHRLVLLLGAGLVAVIAHHFLEAIFAALCKFSIVSMMHFCQSVSFAVLSLGLLWWWRLAAESIVVAYGLACLLSIVVTLAWKGRDLCAEAAPDAGVPHREFWPPLLRFAVWVWITNLLCHLFAVVDRYMLIHWSGLENSEALALVGHYHASRIVPLLFLCVADLMAGIVLPYLSKDWERGDQARVSERLNLILKSSALVMLAGGVVVLAVSPWLFQLAFEGRYDEGLAVLPWTMASCIWYGLLLIGQNYIWCAERMRIGVVPLAVGLVLNVILNAVLIPVFGLLGAVIATTASTGSALATLYLINRLAGMQLQPGMLWLTLAPGALCGGAWCGAATLLVVLALALFSRVLVTCQERQLIVDYSVGLARRIRAHRSLESVQPEATHAI